MTTTSKPKSKFSSRNLSAVFKAPLRTKPLPDKVAGPLLPRSSNRLLVLGQTTTAPPAPINTPSLLKESQTHDAPVSLVPAASNWATNAAVLTETDSSQDQKEKESASDHCTTTPTDRIISSPVADKAWTPESVAEHLHTALVVRPPLVVESSGRWGDDEVENDIIESNVRRQRQKEQDFPNLVEAAEGTHGHHCVAPAAEHLSPPTRSQQSQQHHGRATGRWARFNEHEDMYQPRNSDRWSRDSYSRDQEGHWPRSHCSRGEDSRWLLERFSQRGESGSWSHNRYSRDRDAYGGVSDQFELSRSSQIVLPVPNDGHTHFSSSDVRFDKVASGDHVLSHSPHRMDWSGNTRDRRDTPLSPTYGPQRPRCRATRSISLSVTPTSSSLASPPLSADVSPSRAQYWRRLSPAGRGSDRNSEVQYTNSWPKDQQDTSSTPVAVAATSSTESLSSSSVSDSPTSEQHAQPVTRPKMLFDPKTGNMVNAEKRLSTSKRLATSGGRWRESANTKATHEPISATLLRKMRKTHVCSFDDKQLCTSKGWNGKITVKVNKLDGEKDVNAVLSTSSEVVQRSEGSSAGKDVVEGATSSSGASPSIASGSLQFERNVGEANMIATAKTKNTDTRIAKNDHTGERVKSPGSTPMPAQQCAQEVIFECRPANVKVTLNDTVRLRGNNGRAAQHSTWPRGREIVNDGTSARSVRRGIGGNNICQDPPDRTKKTGQWKPKCVEAKVELLAGDASTDMTGCTGDQERVEVQSEDDGFETVKLRQATLWDRKQLWQRLKSVKATSHASKQTSSSGKKSARGSLPDEQSKGEEAQEEYGFSSMKDSTLISSSKPRGKAASQAPMVDTQLSSANSYGHRATSERRIEGSNKHAIPSTKHVAKNLDVCLRKDQGHAETSNHGKASRKNRVSKRGLKAIASKVCSENKPTAELLQQAAGEAAAESPMPKRSPQIARAPARNGAKRERNEHPTGQVMNDSSCPSRVASAIGKRNQGRNKVHSSKRSTRTGDTAGDSTDRVVEKTEADIPAALASATKSKFEVKSRAASAKARPKQVKQVYVVKTLAPAPTGATSTAA